MEARSSFSEAKSQSRSERNDAQTVIFFVRRQAAFLLPYGKKRTRIRRNPLPYGTELYVVFCPENGKIRPPNSREAARRPDFSRKCRIFARKAQNSRLCPGRQKRLLLWRRGKDASPWKQLAAVLIKKKTVPDSSPTILTIFLHL